MFREDAWVGGGEGRGGLQVVAEHGLGVQGRCLGRGGGEGVKCEGLPFHPCPDRQPPTPCHTMSHHTMAYINMPHHTTPLHVLPQPAITMQVQPGNLSLSVPVNESPTQLQLLVPNPALTLP